MYAHLKYCVYIVSKKTNLQQEIYAYLVLKDVSTVKELRLVYNANRVFIKIQFYNNALNAILNVYNVQDL